MAVQADYGTYKTRSLLPREDADGRTFIFARAMSAATYKTLYVVMPYAGTVGAGAVGVGYIATTIFATGVAASVSAFLGIGNYYLGVADQAVASGSDGWFQIGGPCVSTTLSTCSATTGSYYSWLVASVSAVAASFANYQTSLFGIAMTSNTGGLPAGSTAATYTCHDVYLLNRPVFGIG